jgi:hypothetical protein
VDVPRHAQPSPAPLHVALTGGRVWGGRQAAIYRPHKNGVDDLVLLKQFSNETIAETLKQHFAADEIYVRRAASVCLPAARVP